MAGIRAKNANIAGARKARVKGGRVVAGKVRTNAAFRARAAEPGGRAPRDAGVGARRGNRFGGGAGATAAEVEEAYRRFARGKG